MNKKQIEVIVEYIAAEVLADMLETLNQMYLNREISSDEYWRRRSIYDAKISFEQQYEVNKILIARAEARIAMVF